MSRGTNKIVGVEPGAIYTEWRRAADGQWPAGELPELWDGKAAQRIVNIVLGIR